MTTPTGFLTAKFPNYHLKVKKLNPWATIPEKAHDSDLGYDLFSDSSFEILPGQTEVIDTGIACNFPEGFGAIIKDRSSMASKANVFVVGGVIDQGYTGEIKVILYNSTDTPYFVKHEQKIAQMILTPVVTVQVKEVEELDETDRGSKGFGSTGN